MKLITVLLLFFSFNSYAQEGYYFFTSSGQMNDVSQNRNRTFASHEFYSDTKPSEVKVYQYLDLYHPNFNYRMDIGTTIHGPYASKEEARKKRQTMIDRLRSGVQRVPVVNVIFRDSSVKEEPADPDKS